MTRDAYGAWATRADWVEMMLALNRRLGKLADSTDAEAREELGALYDACTSPERIAAMNSFEPDPGKQD